MAYLGKTPSQAVRSRYYFTATGSETSLSGTDDNSNTLTFTDGNYVDVALNGVTLVAGTDYNTTTANTIGGLTALVASDVVEVIVYDTFSVFGGNVKGDFDISNGNLTVDTDTLYVDSTNDRVGIGTSSPSEKIHVKRSGATGVYLRFEDSTGSAYAGTDSGHLQFFSGGATERMRITSGGNVGIGTTSPGEALHVASAGKIKASRSDNARAMLLYTDNNAATVESDFDPLKLKSADRIAFETGGANERMRVTSGGNVGIGTTSPASTLHLSDSANNSQLTISSTDYNSINEITAGLGHLSIFANTTQQLGASYRYMNFGIGTSESMRIDSSGNVGIGTTSPSRKLSVDKGTGAGYVAEFKGTNTLSVYDSATDGIGIGSGAGDNLRLYAGDNYSNGITVDTNGKLGIGTSSPSSYDSRANNLVVGDSGDAGITIFSGSTSDARLVFAASGDTGLSNGQIEYDNNDDKLRIATGGSDRFAIDGSGNVVMGGTTAGGNGTITAYPTGSGGEPVLIWNKDASGSTTAVAFKYNDSTKGSITYTSSSTSYNTSSDHRLKENAVDMTGAITRVKSLQPKRFNFIVDTTDTLVDGFMAHEAATVVPEAVTGTHNEVETWTQAEIDAGDAPVNTNAGDNKLDGDGNTIPVYQSIDQSKLVPLLTGALQEAITKIETLETEMTALKARVTTLENA